MVTADGVSSAARCLIGLWLGVFAANAAAGDCAAFTSTDVPAATPPFGVAQYALVVSESRTIADIDVQLSIAHDYPGELQIALRSPAGTWVTLFDNEGGFGKNLTGTVLDDGALEPIAWGSPPFNGTFRPRGALGRLVGEDAQGEWVLRIRDTEQGDGGTLTAWEVRLDCSAGPPFAATAETCPENGIFSQLPDPPNENWLGAFSEGGTPAYDNFSGLDAPITGLRWWGTMGFGDDCTRDPNRYAVTFYEDLGDGPGDAVHEEIVTPTFAPTGIVYNDSYPLYRFDAPISPPADLASGWISIVGDGEASCHFAWTDSSQGDAYARRWSGPRLQYFATDFAFCLRTGPDASIHTADQDGDNAINLSELLRVIQFYNSDGYHCAVGTEDGFDPGPGPQACAPHASDYNPQNWRINLTELLRLIQFYNSGGYHACPGEDTEDGYCPGSL